MDRTAFRSLSSHDGGGGGGGRSGGDVEELFGPNPVLLCIDRSQSTQIMLDAASDGDGDGDGGADGDGVSDAGELDGRGIPFVSIETAGVYGRVFCDFGKEFRVVDEDGETPKTTLVDNIIVEGGGDDGGFLVNCVEGERHDVSKGDTIVFQFNDHSDTIDQGDYRCTVLYVKNPTTITVEMVLPSQTRIKYLQSRLNDPKGGNSFKRVKVPRTIPFLPLDDAIRLHERHRRRRCRASSTGKSTSTSSTSKRNRKNREEEERLFAASDLDKSFDPVRRDAVMTCFRALDGFVRSFHRLPSTSTTTESNGDNDDNDDDDDDLTAFSDLASARDNDDDIEPPPQFSNIVRQFSTYARAKFPPLQALYGALGAQEALKAASGLYVPVQQFLLYDCDEILSDNHSGGDTSANASGMAYLLGNTVADELASQKLFVVGAGAIGCEILKNLAAMGAGTGGKTTKKGHKRRGGGRIVLTDMDTIERSNLSRQLLFRDG